MTLYRPARHPKRKTSVEEALIADVFSECSRRNLPWPDVEVISLATGPRGGVNARLRLDFSVAVEGPVLLGQNAHKSGGMFEVESNSPHSSREPMISRSAAGTVSRA